MLKFKTWFGYEVDLEPETFSKVMLLGFDFWDSGYNGPITPRRWFFTDASGSIEDINDYNGYATAEEAALAGIKYYTSGNKP